jgi:ABC-type transport system involved in cytochrome c biogenesis permease subunit
VQTIITIADSAEPSLPGAFVHLMPILWLRVALGFYAVGTVYALFALTGTSSRLNRIALPAMTMGMVFQFVSLTEAVLRSGQIALGSVSDSESLLALLVMAAFLIVFLIYRTTSPGIVVFPLVFVLTFVSATGQQPFLVTSPGLRHGWLIAHIAFIFTGYAALFLSFSASLLYLAQERSLKSKKAAGLLLRLPALEVIDEIGYRSLLLGFPFMTLGLVAGMVVAQAAFGRIELLDPKILLSILMWAVYMLMLYTRWNAGWRGRRAAYLATGAFVAALIAWSANYFSAIHRFVQS